MLVSPQALASGCKNPEAWKVLSLPPGGARPGLSSGRGPGSLQEDAVPLGPTAAHRPQEQSSHLSTRIAGTTSALRSARRVSWALPAARGLLQPVQQLWGSISRGHASNATISPQEHPAACAASTPGLRDGAEGPAVATALPPAAAFLRLRAALQRTLNHRSSPAEPRLLAGGVAAVPCLASLGAGPEAPTGFQSDHHQRSGCHLEQPRAGLEESGGKGSGKRPYRNKQLEWEMDEKTLLTNKEPDKRQGSPEGLAKV